MFVFVRGNRFAEAAEARRVCEPSVSFAHEHYCGNALSAGFLSFAVWQLYCLFCLLNSPSLAIPALQTLFTTFAMLAILRDLPLDSLKGGVIVNALVLSSFLWVVVVRLQVSLRAPILTGYS